MFEKQSICSNWRYAKVSGIYSVRVESANIIRNIESEGNFPCLSDTEVRKHR